LTIRETTKSVTLKGEYQGPGKDPWGMMRIGFSLTGEIDREDFGLTWNQALETGGVLVAKKVKIQIEAQLVDKADCGAHLGKEPEGKRRGPSGSSALFYCSVEKNRRMRRRISISTGSLTRPRS